MTKSTKGAIGNAIYRLGRSIVEGKNPFETIAEDAAFGGVVGGALGLPLGKAANQARAVDVKGINQLRRKDGADWGIPWRKASGNPEKAIQILTEEKRGFVPNAFSKSGIGDVDIPWGNEYFGLQHIIKRRNEQGIDGKNFVKGLPDVIKKGNPFTKEGHIDRKYISDDINEIAIRNNYKLPEGDDIQRNWINSSYELYDDIKKTQAAPVLRTSETVTPPNRIPSTDLGTKNSINNFLYKSNPAGWVNSEAATTARAAGNLMTNGGTYNVQPYTFETQIEYNQQVPAEKIFTPEEIGKMTPEEFNTHEHAIRNQLQRGLITTETKDYSGFKNPLTGTNKIYTREDIGAMSTDEFSAAEPEINAQWGSVGIPAENEIRGTSGAIYVEGYTRADGTKVRGYYRSR